MSTYSQPPLEDREPPPQDEGGLRPPPGLSFWGLVWWWFYFLILVKLARLRFIAVLIVIGIVITQWDTLTAWYNKLTRVSAPQAAAAAGFEYFCPMHPTVIRDNPREKCPICFMPLSKRKKGQTNPEVLPAGVVNRVQLTPYRVALAGVNTWEVGYQPLVKEITAVGFIEFNERGQRTVPARVSGRIDSLFINETGKIVNEGDSLASLYSPDLFVTMQNLLAAKTSGNQSLLADTRKKLELLGISRQQIDDVLATGKADTHITIRMPITGHVIKKYVREGDYVEEGMPLYDVADLSTVWVQAQVYEDDLPFLPTEQVHTAVTDGRPPPEVEATLPSFSSEPFRGRISFIYPHVDQETRTTTVRLEILNPGHRLRPGSSANVLLKVRPQDIRALLEAAASDEAKERIKQGLVLAVPDSSVIDTGTQKIVYRQAAPGVFEGVLVVLGPRMTNTEGVTFYPLLRGVAAGETIVTSGSFLVDAETRLNPAAGSIYFGGSAGSKGAGSSVTTVRPSTPEDSDAKVTAALAKLEPKDRALATSQKFCPIIEDSLLGSMGKPVKLTIEGETVFICCEGCKAQALAKPKETLAKVKKLREAKPAGKSQPKTLPKAPVASAETKIRTSLAKLSVADRTAAEKQKFCVVNEQSRLGLMGVPVKVEVGGQSVFLCCEGCRESALENPEETLAKLRKRTEERK